MSSTPRVVRNDWSTVPVPDLDGWRPTRSVSVVIPAYNCQATLELTLASLSRQTYPAGLLEVVVVDDGSDPPLALPAIRPERTVLVRSGSDHGDGGDRGDGGDGTGGTGGTGGWGRANALRTGARRATGEILHWLDADMVVLPEHVAAQARWQHVLPYAVTLGYKRFVEPPAPGAWPSPEEVAAAWDAGAAGDLFPDGTPHSYVERYIAQTDQLRTADHLAFRIHVGATAALTRELYEAAGGVDPRLRLGEDTEFGYRLAQAGAVFVPEPRARSWHLGPTHVMRAREQVARYNGPHHADRIPFPRHWRRTGGPIRSVPLVEVVMPVDDQPLERVRAAVDSVLRGTEPDIRVNLVGPWDQLDDARVPVLRDPRLDLRLVAASYRAEPRVRLVTGRPDSAFPAPYLLELPVGCGLAVDGVRRLVELADRHRAGAVRVDPPGAVLWRTSALSRARQVRDEGEPLLGAVASVHGVQDVAPDEAGLVDLRPYDLAELANGVPDAASRSRRRTRLVVTTVEVEGVRSWARATAVVARLVVRRARALLRPPRRS